MSKKPAVVRQLLFNKHVALGLEFISLDNRYAQARRVLREPHRASFYMIIWFQKGTPTHVTDFHPVQVPADSFLFIRRDAVQFLDQRNAFEASLLIFTDAFFCKNENDHLFLQNSILFNDLNGSKGPEPVAANKQLRELWHLMQAEEKGVADVFQSALLKNYLSNFILLATREQVANGRQVWAEGLHFDQVAAFKRDLEQYFKTKKSVSFYTRRLFITAKVLNHATQVTLGKSPKQMIDQRVMLEAKRLLVNSKDAVKAIGMELGFEEPTNFNKFFKKHEGVTPAEFRKDY